MRAEHRLGVVFSMLLCGLFIWLLLRGTSQSFTPLRERQQAYRDRASGRGCPDSYDRAEWMSWLEASTFESALQANMYKAIIIDDVNALQRLLRDNPDVVITASAKRCLDVMLLAAHWVNADALRELLRWAPSLVDSSDDDGYGVLHYVIHSCHLGTFDCSPALDLLVASGADIDHSAGEEGITPLILAIVTGQSDIVNLLIELGADKMKPDAAGVSPERYARLMLQDAQAYNDRRAIANAEKMLTALD